MKYYINYLGGSKVISYAMFPRPFPDKNTFTSEIVGMHYDDGKYINKSYNMIDFLNLFLGYQGSKLIDLTDSKIFEQKKFNLNRILDFNDKDIEDYAISLFKAIYTNQDIEFEDANKEDIPFDYENKIEFIGKLNELVYKADLELFNLEKFNKTLTKPLFLIGRKFNEPETMVYFTTPGYFVNVIDTKTLDFDDRIYKQNEKLVGFKDRFGVNMELVE